MKLDILDESENSIGSYIVKFNTFGNVHRTVEG
jgi:hypothetical protein